VPLRVRHLLGRAPDCHTRFDEPVVSGLHAQLRWREGRWVLHDLGSVNGTRLGEQQWLHGGRLPLVRGQRFSLGGQVLLELVDDGPPEPFAVREDGVVVEGVGRELYLPMTDGGEAVLLPDAGEDWVLLADEEPASVRDGARVQVGGWSWTLALSTSQQPTMSRTRLRLLADTRLRFEVSEAAVCLVAEVDEQRVVLGTGRWVGLLLALARRRLVGGEVGERGWLAAAVICAALAISEVTLEVLVHRARGALRAQGWDDAVCIIERREPRELRLGVDAVWVDPELPTP